MSAVSDYIAQASKGRSMHQVITKNKVITQDYGNFSITVETIESGSPLLEVLEEIRLDYISIAKQEIHNTFDDLNKVTIIVDGKTNGNIDLATLHGTGIIAYEAGSAGVEDMKKAYLAAMSYLSSVAGKFIRTGYYESSGFTADFFTVLVNGIEQEPDWNTATSSINIQIYSKARYAAPLEVIKDGTVLLGARNRAKAAGGDLVNVSFTYRKPTKMGQLVQTAKRTGEKFTPLAVPVVEIGTFAGGTSNYIGNVSRNLNRHESKLRLNRNPPQHNLIHRGIVSHRRAHDIPPTRPK